MGIKDILVHLDASEYCLPRLDAAVMLAGQHQARLQGVYTRSPNQGADRSGTEAEFFQKTARAGIEAEWIEIDPGLTAAGIIEAIRYQAHFVDLVITGQPSPEGSLHCPSNLPEHLILASGRPVLIIPYAGVFSTLGDRILVAWKPGPKSTRALNDALTLLQTASHVNLLSVNPVALSDDKEREKICSHLLRHGISAKVGQVPPSELGIGNILLNLVTDEGIDLLVMGSHIRMRGGNPDLGPAGKYLLKRMTVPVLMSQ